MVPTARIMADRRLLVTVLALLAAVNVVGLVVVFGPLRSRVQGLTERATSASLAASSAARELAAAKATSAGRRKADTDITRFYTEILPASQPAARQMTYVRLAQLARDSNLSYEHRSFGFERPEKEGVLSRATLSMSVAGTYRDLRRFIYRLESGDEFVVIQQVGVTQGDDPDDLLSASLTLATYFKAVDGN